MYLYLSHQVFPAFALLYYTIGSSTVFAVMIYIVLMPVVTINSRLISFFQKKVLVSFVKICCNHYYCKELKCHLISFLTDVNDRQSHPLSAPIGKCFCKCSSNLVWQNREQVGATSFSLSRNQQCRLFLSNTITHGIPI